MEYKMAGGIKFCEYEVKYEREHKHVVAELARLVITFDMGPVSHSTGTKIVTQRPRTA